MLCQAIESSNEGLHWLTRLLAASVESGVLVYNILAGHEVVVKFISDDIVLFLRRTVAKRPENVIDLVMRVSSFSSSPEARPDAILKR